MGPKIYPLPGRFGELPVALTVIAQDRTAPLSPLFAKAAWVAIVEPESSTVNYVRSGGQTSDIIRKVCEERGVHRLICGFIDRRSHARLADEGIDVRLGPCSVPALSLIRRFESLPPAP